MTFLSNLQILEQQIQKKPIKNSSRVPRYQNPLKVVGFCDFQVASPPYREGPWGGWMFFSFFSCAKKRTSICFFLCARESKRYVLQGIALLQRRVRGREPPERRKNWEKVANIKFMLYFCRRNNWFANDENNKKNFYIGYSLDGDGLWGLGQDSGDEESDDCH